MTTSAAQKAPAHLAGSVRLIGIRFFAFHIKVSVNLIAALASSTESSPDLQQARKDAR
jgi:hypothetical protein